MTSLKSSLKTFAEPKFWVDALEVIAGYKASDLLSAIVGSRLPGPAVLKPFVGPILVVLGGAAIGGTHGRNLKLGAFVFAADQILDMVGLPTVG